MRMMVIGLDCVPPKFVFDWWRDELPAFNKLMAAGVYGTLTSTIPPITVPAWACMMTSQDPGQLGIYGFRNRKDHSYGGLDIAHAKKVHVPYLWETLSEYGKTSIVIGVPLTYPVRPLKGVLISSFLAPSKKADFTYPPSVKETLDDVAGGNYVIDVENFRTKDKERLLKQIYEMTRNRFQAAGHFLEKEPWDFFMMVEMGPDRIHHGFWRFTDPDHRLFESGNPYRNAIKEYYIDLDRCVARLLDSVPEDTLVFVVSDHGAKAMQGGICVNEWLIQHGYLALLTQPDSVAPLKSQMVDWSRTRAWGEGGYYARLFLNVQGREPEGTIAAGDYERVRGELKSSLESMTDDKGDLLGTRVFLPEDAYRECRNVPPDLIVYFGNLDWRSIGTVGGGSVHVFENDTGPDDANHAREGIFVMCPVEAYRSFQEDAQPHSDRGSFSIYDVAPTILNRMGVPIPERMIGAPLTIREIEGRRK